ncbi:hypothetical protein MMC06_005676 [Schaereria dolodes]|nr:hypothetical protein [Schaereria dolodes]
MFFNLHSFRAFAALVLLCPVSLSNAGHLRANRHIARTHQHLHKRNIEVNGFQEPAHGRGVGHYLRDRQAREANASVDLSDIRQLQSANDAFSQWMSTWFTSSNATNTVSSLAQVQEEIEAYEGRMTTWFSMVTSSEASKSSTRKRDTTVLVTSSDIQQLQTEFTAFSSWMSSWLSSADSTNSASAVAQLQEEVQAYEGWIKAWLSTATSGGISTLPQLPTTSPAAPASPSAVVPVAITTNNTVQPSTTVTAASDPLVVSSVLSPNPNPPSTPLPTTSQKESPGAFVQTSASSSSMSLSVTPLASPSSPSKLLSGSGTAPHASSGSGFNAQASNNVAVYFGNSDSTGFVGLDTICQDTKVDIIVLAFLNGFFSNGGYPVVNFGAACSYAQTSDMTGTSLLSCPDLAKSITTCQGQGKKVLLSLGGADATSTFTSDSQASQFATTIWDLFGGGRPDKAGLRPFGTVKVDGFDIDNESHEPASYNQFVSSLRSLFASDSSKNYYISAAPQCPQPDASIPLDAMKTMDFVWVQFYNNGNCNVGQAGFLSSFTSWAQSLGNGPRLYLGAMAKAVDGTGYLDVGTMQGVVKQAMGAGAANFGGVMLWDGSQAVMNGNYQDEMKDTLMGG